MLFGQLRSAIRKHKGTVTVEATLAGGQSISIPVQKTPFIKESLPAAFGGEEKNLETGLTFLDGHVFPEGGGAPAEPVRAAEATLEAPEPVTDLDLDLTDLDLTAGDDDPLDLTAGDPLDLTEDDPLDLTA